MKRMTFRKNGKTYLTSTKLCFAGRKPGERAFCIGCSGEQGTQDRASCGPLALIDRLADYEDTGLEPEKIETLLAELDAAKTDIAALLWLDGHCEYCRFGGKDTYRGASRWNCLLGAGVCCSPEWRGLEKENDNG